MSLAKELLKDAFSRGILSLEGSFSATLPFIEKNDETICPYHNLFFANVKHDFRIL